MARSDAAHTVHESCMSRDVRQTRLPRQARDEAAIEAAGRAAWKFDISRNLTSS
jgi:hypothetical protein